MNPQLIAIQLSQGHRHSLSAQLRFMSGLLALVVLPLSLRELLNGDGIGLFFPVVILAMLALARYMARADEDELFLQADGIERRRVSERVEWGDVLAIRWPVNSDHPDIRLVTKEGLVEQAFAIDFSAVTKADKLTLIRYLRLNGQNIEQTGWPSFCHREAISLLNEANGAEPTLAVADPLAWNERFVSWGCTLLVERPFLAGLTAPLIFLIFFAPLMISRRTAWTLAALIALSAVINIYLFWGKWLSPFTEVAVGGAVVFVILGALAVYRPNSNNQVVAKRSKIVSNVAGLFYLSALIIGVPLYLNLIAQNAAPALPVAAMKWGALTLLFGPIVLLGIRSFSSDQASHADATQLWEKSESTEIQ